MLDQAVDAVADKVLLGYVPLDLLTLLLGLCQHRQVADSNGVAAGHRLHHGREVNEHPAGAGVPKALPIVNEFEHKLGFGVSVKGKREVGLLV